MIIGLARKLAKELPAGEQTSIGIRYFSESPSEYYREYFSKVQPAKTADEDGVVTEVRLPFQESQLGYCFLGIPATIRRNRFGFAKTLANYPAMAGSLAGMLCLGLIPAFTILGDVMSAFPEAQKSNLLPVISGAVAGAAGGYFCAQTARLALQFWPI